VKRRLFNLAAAVSLLLCVATAGLWVRALNGSNDYIEWQSRSFQQIPTTESFEKWDRTQWIPDAIFVFGRQPFFGYPRNSFSVHFYYWAVLPATATLPAIAAWQHIRRRRTLAARRCAICGYDLRATPRRCPECGTVPSRGRVTS
jgi:hypothetical protein